jgi:SAM-dependent methyltransferase
MPIITKFYPFIRGVSSYILPNSIFNKPGSGGTFSSEYCYSVWLRHLIHLKKAGLIKSIQDIRNIAEIGPGDSLGIGLSAIYSGAENYYAFDVIKHTNEQKNRKINDDLVQYFINQLPVPHNSNALRNTKPVLADYSFPLDILNRDEAYYSQKHRLISENLNNLSEASNIHYIVPWMSKRHSHVSNIDLIFSQAVMEHVDDIEFAYAEMYNWLKPGGIISHQIDFKAHEMSDYWDGHFFIGSKLWKILAHGRKYPMNRLPLSVHLSVLKKLGFKIVNVVPFEQHSNFPNKNFKVPGVTAQQSDYYTSSALIQAYK